VSVAHTARCRCGQLVAECTGEPVRVSVCHCLDCKKRSGSAFAAQVRFPTNRVAISGRSTEWNVVGDSGNPASFNFCPVCGSTLWYRAGPMTDAIAIPLGNFENPHFAAPAFSVWEERKQDWVTIHGDGVEHCD
jgi:hypothetical protein